MTSRNLLQKHLELCDELYELTVEENRLLTTTGRPPDAAWRSKKQALSDRWSESMGDLRAHEPASSEPGGAELERARQRCLQILHLDRENEKLLLRCSLVHPKPPPPTVSAQTAAKAYASPPPPPA